MIILSTNSILFKPKEFDNQTLIQDANILYKKVGNLYFLSNDRNANCENASAKDSKLKDYYNNIEIESAGGYEINYLLVTTDEKYQFEN